VNFTTGTIPLGGRAPKNVCTSPGDGKTSCKALLTSVEWRWCSNEAKTRNWLKFAGVPQTRIQISAVSGPKFTILWGHVEEILLFNNFFPIVDTCLSCEDYSPTNLCDGAQMAIFSDFLRPVFSPSRVQHISDMHSKFALRAPYFHTWCAFRAHHVWKYGRHPICDSWD